jgi:hypothetical protein
MATMYQDPFGAADYSAEGTRGLLEFLREEYPRVYGAGAGLLQSSPYDMANQYSVFDPKRQAAFNAAEMAFPVGLALDVIPGVKALKEPAKKTAKAVGQGGKALARMAGSELDAAMFGERGGLLGMMTPQPAFAVEPSKKISKKQSGVANVKSKVSPITFDIGTPEGAAAFEKKYGRKPVHLMSEKERVKEFGAAMAETPEVQLSDIRSRQQLAIPGGFDGPPMTLADQAKISAQAIDYNTLDPQLALDIHKRLVQSVDPGANPSDLELMNRLGFGITSGNAPITKNLVEWAQLRPRSTAEVSEWAGYSPVGPSGQIPGGANPMNTAINEAYGVQASGRGGTGVANTANRQYVSDLAKMMESNPDFFRRMPNEPEAQYVERLMNQVRGLGPKTGSLGFAMVEPQTSNISAIDRHIADLTREAVKNNPATKSIYEQQMLNAYNLGQPKKNQRKTYAAARKLAGDNADVIEAEKFREVVSSPSSTKFIDAKTGQMRSTVPPHLANLPFYEPEFAQTIGPMYSEALSQIQQGGQKRGIGGFSNQWYDWDYQRSRAEPHAALNPMATSMQRMTPEEYKLVRDTFSQAGAMQTRKDPATGRLIPLKPTQDYRKLIYGSADPYALAGAGAAGAGGLGLLSMMQDEE